MAEGICLQMFASAHKSEEVAPQLYEKPTSGKLMAKLFSTISEKE